MYEEESENRQATFHRRAAIISREFPHPGRLLDVGCSTGLFAAEAAKLGWQVTGIDPSAWAVSIARQRVPSGEFFSTPVESASFPGSPFDVIVLWDLLEHVDHPREVLSRLDRWIKPDGHIHLDLPNIDSLIARVMGRYWPMLLREHLWYFSPKTISCLLQEYGYEVLRIQSNRVRFSFENIGRRLSQYPGFIHSISNRISSVAGADRISIWFPTGEMEVAARKHSAADND